MDFSLATHGLFTKPSRYSCVRYFILESLLIAANYSGSTGTAIHTTNYIINYNNYNDYKLGLKYT